MLNITNIILIFKVRKLVDIKQKMKYNIIIYFVHNTL